MRLTPDGVVFNMASLMSSSENVPLVDGGPAATSASKKSSPVEGGLPASRAEYWSVLLVAVMALWSVFAIYIQLCLLQTYGHLTNTTDDSYITMAVARNLAQNGTWGIQPGQFASLVSSPGWVLLMAAVFRLVGPAEWVPLAMNLFCATLLFVLIWAIFRSFRARPLSILLGLFLVLLLTPMVPVAFTGLEHILQACVDLAYVFAVGTALGEDAPPSRKRMALATLLWLSPVLTLVRYEGVFLIAAAGCVLLARKQFKAALLTGVLGMLPIVVSGLIFISKGWFFFPSTLIQKGNLPTGRTPSQYVVKLGEAVFLNLHNTNIHIDGAHLAVLMGLVLLACLCLRQPMLSSRLGVMASLFVGAAFLHLELARLGWFYRYEAYLVCMGLVVLVLLTVQLPWQSLLLPQVWPKWVRAAPLSLSVALVMEPLLDRAFNAHIETPLASRNNWEQQYQMARFLHTYYEGASVAANDIGAISFYSGTRCFDLTGLGDATVTRLIMDNRYDTSVIRGLTRQHSVKIAVAYENGFAGCGGLPHEWVKAGDWTIFDNCVCSDQTVSFYAVDPAELPALRGHLEEFMSRLPNSVFVRLKGPIGRQEPVKN
jgi:hypothetical protein